MHHDFFTSDSSIRDAVVLERRKNGDAATVEEVAMMGKDMAGRG